MKKPNNFFQYASIIFRILNNRILLLTLFILISGMVDLIGITMFAPLLSTITDNLDSNKIKVIDSNVDEIKACQIPFSAEDSYWPNLPTNARGLYVSDNCNLDVKNISIENIIDTPECLIPSEVEIYSDVKFN